MGIRLTPAGRLRWESSGDEAAPAGSPSLQSAFESDWREALFTLAADKIPVQDRPSVRYWQQLAERHLTGLCHVPEDAGTFEVEPPSSADCARPGMGNYLVGIFKDTPMLSVIGVAELMHTANALGSETYRFLEPYTLVGIIFLAISLPAAGGQQQRVAITRALAMRPRVMLLDEVTSALDPEVIGEVLAVIRQLNSEHSLTMLMVTHQMGFAREISDRVCFFHSGRIEEQGPPAQIFGDPRSPRTRQFLSAVLEAH